ncbi:RNA-protein complex protein Nop10 [Candidatus Micrarchaeota archaeon]|nr:RNA-protein complex protein Nop10 [Candidatus Micrarchaeota archaeon]
MKKTRFCNSCNMYTLSYLHCNITTISAHPPKFNLKDKYGGYRRRAKFGV